MRRQIYADHRRAGHPVFTGVVPLAKGILIDEGASEHFTKHWQNEEMLVRLIYDSNMLTSFIALWKHAPGAPKVTPPAETMARATKSAAGDPVRSSSPADRKTEGRRKRAAGDRGDDETSASNREAGKKRRSEERETDTEAQIEVKKRTRKGAKIDKKAMPANLHYFLYKLSLIHI